MDKMYTLRYQKGGLIREISIRASKRERRCTICGGCIKKGKRYIRLTLGNLYIRRFKRYAICFDCWVNIKSKLKDVKEKIENASRYS
ncbi:MAG TPA: hypothetical protein EYH22_00605 [Candidatus Nanopusillus sp.]|nr:hypothetical protein [Candidatus Nanopusillus sp.]